MLIWNMLANMQQQGNIVVSKFPSDKDNADGVFSSTYISGHALHYIS